MPRNIEYFIICVLGRIKIYREANIHAGLRNSTVSPKAIVENKNVLKIIFGNAFWEESVLGGCSMRKKGYKGRCEKKNLSKSMDVCRSYDAIQSVYADILQQDENIQEIRCNVLLDGLSEGDYTSDFVCIRKDDEWMVRECVFRKFLTKPMTVRLLDTSREYWLRHGISDWGIVIDEERKSTEKSVIAT